MPNWWLLYEHGYTWILVIIGLQFSLPTYIWEGITPIFFSPNCNTGSNLISCVSGFTWFSNPLFSYLCYCSYRYIFSSIKKHQTYVMTSVVCVIFIMPILWLIGIIGNYTRQSTLSKLNWELNSNWLISVFLDITL